MTLAQIKKNIKHGDYSILQKLLRLSTESAARQKFLRGDKDALEGMIKIQENRSIFCDLHADEDCSCHEDLKEAINQKADINHTHDWNEITGKPTEFPPTHHLHDVRDIEGLDDVLHTIDEIRNLSNQKLDKDGSNATGSLASTINNNHNHVNKAVLDTITALKVNDWDNAAGKAHNAVTLGSNAAGLTITNQVLQFSNGYQLPTTIKVSEWDDAYLKRHTHGNKTVLDNLTQSVIDQSHAHSNKSVIDGITTQMVNNWNGSFANSHTHNNKSTLDGISSADVTNWDAAHANSHTHVNKVILDAITAAYTVAEKNKLATIQPNAQVNVKADWNATSGDSEILNKPSSFTPASHNHAISDIAGLQSELDSKLETAHLNGFVHDVAYNSSLHTLTFYQRNEPNIVIDLPIEHLIKGVQLHGNDLVFTFEDGSNVTIPMNTLLVGVVKSVNGLVANSQGEVVLDINDISGLQSVLDGKVNVDGGNLTNIANWRSELGIDSISNTLPNKADVDGNNLVNISSWQKNLDILTKESIYVVADCNITTLGRGLVQPTTLNAPANYGELVTTQTSTWIYQTFYDTNNIIWHRQNINSGGFTPWLTITDDSVLLNYAKVDGSNLTNIANWQSVLGVSSALNLNLQQVTNNGNFTTNDIRSGSNFVTNNVDSTGYRGMQWNTNGELRWLLCTDPNGEGGGNTGSPLSLYRYSDGGAYLGQIFTINRETGLIRFNDNIVTTNHYGSAEWSAAYETTLNLNNNFIKGSNNSGVAQNYNFAIGYDGIKNFIQSHGSKKLTLNPEGNYVGIGTDDPQTTLHVYGNNYIEGRTGSTAGFVVQQSAGIGNGIALYGTSVDDSYNPEYGLMFATTGNYGTMGSVNGDWATYFTMAGASNRGWIFRHQGIGNVASINGEGVVSTMYHGNSGQWQEAFTQGLLRNSSGGLNNASNSNVSKYFFDYNWANTGRPGSVASFGTLGGGYQTELFGQYNEGGEYFGVRTKNDDNGTWNPVRQLIHDGNINTYVNNITGNYLPLSGGTFTNGGRIDAQGNLTLQQQPTSNATGLWWNNMSDTQNISGIGSHTSGDVLHRMFMGWGDNPWNPSTNFSVSDAELQYKDSSIWHAGNLFNVSQLSNDANYISSAALTGYALVNQIPIDNSQLANGAGYITAASLPNVSNATVTYQGTGAITGGGSHTINQSGNSTYNFDLTNQTKNEISLGVNAYNSLSSKQDALVAGSGISIIGNTISATGSGGGGIVNISTDNSQQPGPTASQVPLTFTSHEAYGKPETQIDDQEYGNLTMKAETGDVVRFYGSLDNVFTDIQPTGSICHLDIDGLRKHIYNIIFQSSGGTGGTVRFDSGIYTGDQINITVPAGQQITIQSSASIVSLYGNGGGFECQTHANLIWDSKFDAWVLVSYN